jgi:hypothetical protein
MADAAIMFVARLSTRCLIRGEQRRRRRRVHAGRLRERCALRASRDEPSGMAIAPLREAWLRLRRLLFLIAERRPKAPILHPDF